MRQSARLSVESLENRFAPASLAAHPDFDWVPKQQALPTVPVLGGLASSPLGVAVLYGSAGIGGSSDPGGDGI